MNPRCFTRNAFLRIFLISIFHTALSLFYFLSAYSKQNSKHYKIQHKQNFDHAIERDFKYNVSCRGIFEMDREAISSAKLFLASLKVNKSFPGVISDSNFIFNRSLCAKFKNERQYNQYHIDKDELSFPLAFSLLLNENIE
jgi:hypothetical protein